MPHSEASDLGLHCLPITLLGVSRLQWVNDMSILTVILCHLPEQARNGTEELVDEMREMRRMRENYKPSD